MRRALRTWWHRIGGLFAGAASERDLANELRSHLDLHADELRQSGLSPEQARRQAVLALGGTEQAKEQYRDRRGIGLVAGLGQEVRYAFRGLGRTPVFSSAVVATLALTIGANIAIFSLVDRIVLRPLDVRNPSELVTVQHTFESRGVQVQRHFTTWENARRVRDMSTLASTALSTSSLDPASRRLAVSVDGAAESTAVVDGRFITANYFRVLGLAPMLGRDFGPADDTVSAPPVVILSHRFWRSQFGDDVGAIGRTVRINGTSVVVVGVAPPTFAGTELAASPPDLFLPLMTGSRLAASGVGHNDGRGRLFVGGFDSGQHSIISPVRDLTVIGRLKDATDAQAQAELTALLDDGEWKIVPLVEALLPFDSRAELRQFLLLLAGAVGLTLLIGCANLASLFLARAEERRSELAVRAALGAGRGRLLQQLAVEAGILGGAGGLTAVAVARWIDHGLAAFVLPGGVGVSSLRDGGDARTFVFTLCVTAFAVLVVSIGPAARVASRRLALDIQTRAGTSARLGAARALVTVQVTVCIVLVFGAALFVRSVSKALATDLGFDPRGLVSILVSVTPKNPGPSLDGLQAVDALVLRARELPSVDAVTAGPLPIVKGSDILRNQVRIDGVPADLATSVDVVHIAADYFATLGQAVVGGREFGDADRARARPVAIVNEAAARQFWPGTDALDRQIGFWRVGDFTVVGVVRDVKLKNLRETARPVVYLARLQHQPFLAGFMGGAGNAYLIVRAGRDPVGAGRALVHLAADAGISVQAVTTLDQGMDELLMPQRLGRALLLLLGTVALTLTFLGIYGLVSCVVVRSRKELGVRLALGAGVRDVVRTLLSAALWPVMVGAAAGSLLAWSGGHLADRFMYGITGSDSTTMALAVVTIVGGALLAVSWPIRRALRINPIEVLRAE